MRKRKTKSLQEVGGNVLPNQLPIVTRGPLKTDFWPAVLFRLTLVICALSVLGMAALAWLFEMNIETILVAALALLLSIFYLVSLVMTLCETHRNTLEALERLERLDAQAETNSEL